jgi:hypothetical protein
MKFQTPLIALVSICSLHASDIPKFFDGLFTPNVPINAQIGIVMPPPEIDKYVAKVETAARLDSKWFKEYSGQSTPGAPLPYDKRLGLTQEEYNEYLKLWARREFKPIEDVTLMLHENAGNTWILNSTGSSNVITTLRYEPKADVFESPSGTLKRLKDINADPASILGKWTGHEWKFEENSSLGDTRENFAIGQLAGNKYGIIIYRSQEISTTGTKMLDKSILLRFPIGKTPVKVETPAKPTSKKK